MKREVQVIVPVGPGHEDTAIEAIKSAYDLGLDVIVIDDTEGKMGRSKARNTGVELAEAEWLFFLDSDDRMHKGCKRAFEYMNDYDAIWGLINRNGQVAIPQVRNVTFDDLLFKPPYLCLQIGHFVRTTVAIMYPFDESMDCGEDFDYYLRVWSDPDIRSIKIPHTLFVNHTGNHSTGPRSATGREWTESVGVQQMIWKSQMRKMM